MRLLEAFALKECSHDVCLTQYVKAAAETHRYSRLFLEVMSTAVSDNMLKLTIKTCVGLSAKEKCKTSWQQPPHELLFTCRRCQCDLCGSFHLILLAPCGRAFVDKQCLKPWASTKIEPFSGSIHPRFPKSRALEMRKIAVEKIVAGLSQSEEERMKPESTSIVTSGCA